MLQCCVNGDFFHADALLLPVQNRAFRYGDGCFETMRLMNGSIHLQHLHTERLLMSLKLLQIHATEKEVAGCFAKAVDLCELNKCTDAARIRVQVFRSGNAFQYAIEALPLTVNISPDYSLDLYVHCKKSCDAFANIKSANFLPYVMAALEAERKGVDDCLVLNTSDHICDSARANLFIIKDNRVMTPALHQGCINGVMRRFTIDSLKQQGIAVYQREVSEADLLRADAVFLTNAIMGIQPVKRYKSTTYDCAQVLSYRKQLLSF